MLCRNKSLKRLYSLLIERCRLSIHFSLRLLYVFRSLDNFQIGTLHDIETSAINNHCREMVSQHQGCMNRNGLFTRERLACIIYNRTATTKSDKHCMVEKPMQVDDSNWSYNRDVTVSGSDIVFPSVYSFLGSAVDVYLINGVNVFDDASLIASYPHMLEKRISEYFKRCQNFEAMLSTICENLHLESNLNTRNHVFHEYCYRINEWLFIRRLHVMLHFNNSSLSGLGVPMNKLSTISREQYNLQIIRLVTEESYIISTNAHCLLCVYLEMCDLDEDTDAVLRENPSYRTVDDVRCKPAPLDDGGFGTNELYMKSAGFLYGVSNNVEYDSANLRDANHLVSGAHSCQSRQDVDQDNTSGVLISFRNMYAFSSVLCEGRREDLLPNISDTDYLHLKDEILESYCQSLTKGPRSFRFNSKDDENSPMSGFRVSSDFFSRENSVTFECDDDNVYLFNSFNAKRERIKARSPYGKFKSWSLFPVLVKQGEDMRQEMLAMQFICMARDLFCQLNIPIWLYPYEILATNQYSGMVEFVNDVYTVDFLKKRYKCTSVSQVFEKLFKGKIYEARKNFIESLAGYSLIMYFLRVRDRHNANIIIDAGGHILHVDYGFMLSNSPGNLSFETGAFKLTQEYLDILENQDNYEHYRRLVILGFLAIRLHVDRFAFIIESGYDKNMPCYEKGLDQTVEEFKNRCFLNMKESTCIAKIVNLLSSSINNSRAAQYDTYQRITQGII